MVQYAFHVDSSVCTGCKTCQVSCQDKNDLTADLVWRHVYDYGGGSWKDAGNGIYVPQNVFRYFLSSACNHCMEPACVEACPTGAMQKDGETGIVWTDHEVCIACNSCAKACPYGAPTLDVVNGYMTKCNMCMDKIAEGEKPECVIACSQRALDWGEYAEMQQQYPNSVNDVEPLPVPSTAPCLLVKPHPKAQASGSGTGLIQNMEEELQ